MKNRSISLITILILAASIISILSISVIGYIWYKNMDNVYTKSINDVKHYYTDSEKFNVKSTVDNIIRSINYDIKYNLSIGKNNGFEKFNESIAAINKTIKYNKEMITKDTLVSILKQELYKLTTNDKSLSYYIFDYNGNCILNPYDSSLENKNLLYLRDFKNNTIIKNLIKTAKEKSYGAIEQFWPYNWQSLNKNSVSRKSFVFYRSLEELGLIIAAVSPIEDMINRLQDKWLGKLSLFRYGKNGHGYIFVAKLNNINGGDCFAIELVNASNPKIVGKCMSDKYKDITGFQFRKVYLSDLRKKGYSFAKYHYYMPNSKKIESKISYLELYKPWNWIIGTGIYIPGLENVIKAKQSEKLQNLNKAKAFIFVLIFGIILFFVATALFFSRLLDNKIDSFFRDFEKALNESKFINEDKYKIKQIKRVAKNFNKAVSKFKEYERKFVEAFVNIIEARDIYTKGHSQRVAHYAYVIAKTLGLDSEKQDMIYKAGLLHDIGKIGIPDNVLLKPGRLSENEYNIIKQHSIFLYELLSRIEHFRGLAKCVRAHHEKCDGSGYPDGLKCEDICIEARILAIADIFDALTTTRPYRKAFSTQKAIEILKKEQVDQEMLQKVENALVDSFLQGNDTEIQFMSEEIDKIRNEIFMVDYMTGLLFITAFIEKIKHCISENRQFFIFRINLKGTSEINYKFSTDTGNRVILDTSKALKQIINDKNKEDILLSRAYADVFLVAYSIKDESEMDDIIKIFSQKSLQNAIKEAVLRDNNIKKNKHDLLDYIDVSVSFAIYPQDGDSVEEIIYKTEKRMKKTT